MALLKPNTSQTFQRICFKFCLRLMDLSDQPTGFSNTFILVALAGSEMCAFGLGDVLQLGRAD